MNYSKILAPNMAQSTDFQATNAVASTAPPMLSPRMRIARLILYYHFALIVVSSVYYLMHGFDREEFTALMGMLGPVTALYGGVVFRFLGKSITDAAPAEAAAEPQVSSIVKWLVHGHFITVLALISLKAIFNFISFEDMTMFFTFVETGLGVYMGNVLLALFERKTM